MFDPLAVKAMTSAASCTASVLGREHRPDPQHGPRAGLPEDDGRPRRRRAGPRQGKKTTEIMALQVGQKGDAYHIYPLFVSGGGSFFGQTARATPDPKNVTVDSAGSIAAGKKLYDLGEKGVGALKRSIDDKNAIPLFTVASRHS